MFNINISICAGTLSLKKQFEYLKDGFQRKLVIMNMYLLYEHLSACATCSRFFFFFLFGLDSCSYCWSFQLLYRLMGRDFNSKFCGSGVHNWIIVLLILLLPTGLFLVFVSFFV